MKLFTLTVSAIALAATAAAAAEPAKFDIWQSAEAGKTTIAIAAIGEKAPFAAAAGADKAALDILPSDEASLVIADLRAKMASKVETAEAAMAEDDEAADDGAMDHADHMAQMDGKPETAEPAAAKKIILVKEIAEGEKTEKKQVRRIIKVKPDGDASDVEVAALVEKAKADLNVGDNAKVEVETQGLPNDDADAALIASANPGKVLVIEDEKDGAATRLVAISGADSAGAISFIDKAEGLDAKEKAKMKAALGL